ncbi:MAG: AAA family ATPase [Deltaproteobacteria bacterium]|nr:AAA family ATPase [Deltaproteobacteria bacterium]
MQNKLAELKAAIQKNIRGSEKTIEFTLAAFLAGGHVLLEGLPGTGKTELAKTFARAFGGEFRRVQMTSDLLPSDIVGVMRLVPGAKEFEFRKGPIFANVVLADELNRTPPKTQSALLEAMAEATVTVDGQTHILPNPFFVLATQNPFESRGVYTLTESQLDRFMLKLHIERPGTIEELEIYRNAPAASDAKIQAAVLEPGQAVQLRALAAKIHVEKSVVEFAAALMRKTVEHPRISAGASVRAGLQLLACARALALVRGREFVTPKEVSDLAHPALGHRLFFHEEDLPEKEKHAVLHDVVASTPAPV